MSSGKLTNLLKLVTVYSPLQLFDLEVSFNKLSTIGVMCNLEQPKSIELAYIFMWDLRVLMDIKRTQFYGVNIFKAYILIKSF